MRRTWIIPLSIPFIAMAMGEGRSVPPELKKVRSTVIDKEGVTHRFTGLVCGDGGEIRFKRGAVDYRLSLTSIEKIEVIKTSGSESSVEVTLADGKKEKYTVSSSLRCVAQTDSGKADFYISDVKSITFHRGEK
jgi:hypothetical protein